MTAANATATKGLSTGLCASLACIYEVSAHKPGNVHRGADFEDLTYVDFLASAAAIAPWMEAAASAPLGKTILSAVEATRAVVRTNSNLGMILLLAPLAAVPRAVSLAVGVCDVLARLDMQDARDVYAAIRFAQPGGLGHSDVSDVADEPQVGLVAAMQIAAERDLVARQYATGFADVLERIAPWLLASIDRGLALPDSIVHTQMQLMSQFPDSLIIRKCGLAVAHEASDRAAAVLSSGSVGDEAYHEALSDFDFWLRSDGHRRNPGTTADLIAAGLFVLLRDGALDGRASFYGPSSSDSRQGLL